MVNGTEAEIGHYFRSNLISLRKAVSEQDFKKFAALSTNSERVAFILRYPEAHSLPTKVDTVEMKNNEKSSEFKDLGNKFFARREFKKAFKHYCLAVHFATGKNLGVALANRSATLYYLAVHDRALEDIEDACRYGYPEEQMYKLLERKAQCLFALRRNEEAIEAFRATLKAMNIANIASQKRQKLEGGIKLMLEILGNKNPKFQNPDNNLQKPQINKREIPIPKIKECNPLYPACSISVKIKNAGGSRGRYAVATRNIEPGELLAVEKPHSAFLLPEYRLNFCHRCLSNLLIPVVADCQICDVLYCSTQCRNQDADLHKRECNILPVLQAAGISITSYISLRVILQKSIDEILKLKDKLELSKDKFEPSPGRPYRSENYETFYGLVTHEDERTAEDMFHRAYMASWLLRLIKTSPYIPENMKSADSPDQELSEIELFIAKLLLHHLQLIQFNAHEMTVLFKPNSNEPSNAGKNVFVGGGVYPTVALLNHSCNPGVVRYFAGTTMVVRAIRTILAGEEICENYGPMYQNETKKERKRKLRIQYWFDCNCEACLEDWPLWADVDANGLRFKCETGPACGNVHPVLKRAHNFLVNCPKCGKRTNILKGLKRLRDVTKYVEVAADLEAKGQFTEALDQYLKIMKLIDTILALPSQDCLICQHAIKMLMVGLGNTLITNNIPE